MQVFLNQPWRQMRTSLILLFGKTKVLFEKVAARKKQTVFLHTLFVENERETSEQKWGGGGGGGLCFSMKLKATGKN